MSRIHCQTEFHINYEEEFSLTHRQKDHNKIFTYYKGEKIPIIVQKLKDSRNQIMMRRPMDLFQVFDIDPLSGYQKYITVRKYIFDRTLSLAHLLLEIRRRNHLDPSIAIFIFINGNIPKMSSLIQDLYEEYKNEDGALYIYYSFERVFG